MPDMNMDNMEHEDATSPILEFTVPSAEIDSDLKMEQKGEVIIPVEVIAKGDTSITFRKIGIIRTDKHFQDHMGMEDMPHEEMRKKMKVLPAEEMEKPFKQDKEEK